MLPPCLTRYEDVKVPNRPALVDHGRFRQYQFLAHAILGLAAQHLTLFRGADYSIQALDLRVTAINGLNEALSQPCLTPTDADARYAAIIALTFQSGYMPDAMIEFIKMLRGWMFIQTKLVPDLEMSIFRNFTREAFTSSMKQHIARQPINKSMIALDDYLASLKIIRTLCQGTAEIKYLSALERLGRLASQSPIEGTFNYIVNKYTKIDLSQPF
ncbi:hypothetical protein TASIC1_0017006100 [Trichoderma asperellum]|uniref:Uncharacterized protein n=1 Tax=Trichoderma asperellum TaxID=101201 RepID=A0A6V8R5Y5_TRIAP|nr:hypothetical protein TASIC1_0017006100 [Trichoderma asperellum]